MLTDLPKEFNGIYIYITTVCNEKLTSYMLNNFEKSIYKNHTYLLKTIQQDNIMIHFMIINQKKI